MRYENPLYLAEEAAALDLLSGGRVALGVSRGSPEPALRGWEAFGYTGSTDPRGADLAREKFDLFMRAVRGEGIAEVRAAIAASRGIGDADWRAKWWTRKYAPLTPISSAPTAISTASRSIAAASGSPGPRPCP